MKSLIYCITLDCVGLAQSVKQSLAACGMLHINIVKFTHSNQRGFRVQAKADKSDLVIAIIYSGEVFSLH